MAIHARTFSSEHDYAQMRQLAAESCADRGALNYGTPGDLDWWRFPHDDQGAITDARLWFDDAERLVALAWPSRDQIDVIVHPDHADLYEEALAWAEEHRQRTGEAGNDPLSLTAWAFENDDARRATLLARGYESTDFAFVHHARGLNTPLPIPMPVLPTGYTLDHIHDDIIESRAAAQRDAFQSTKMTATRYRRLKEAPSYRPELDLVVRDAEGEVVAFALVWFDAVNRTGTFEPVGTRFAHQRRGLARALLHAGMHRLQSLGATTALVLSATEAADRLYNSSGIWTVGRNIAWKKRLTGGVS